MELYVFAIIFIANGLGALLIASVILLLVGLILQAERGVRLGLKGLKIFAGIVLVLAIPMGVLWLLEH